jgi:Cys-tRNA(Pro)/Cys-tRNA(Cys) deacylase
MVNDSAIQQPVGADRGDGMKTNAVRLLEEMGVRSELRAYEVDPDDLTAETVADKIGLPAEQVFKTLVARGDRHGVCFAVVPGNCRLDLKALAKLTGDRKVETAPLKEVQPLTGYVRGRASPSWGPRRPTRCTWTRRWSCSRSCPSRRGCAGCKSC